MHKISTTLLFLFVILLYSCSNNEKSNVEEVDYTVKIIKKLDLAIPSGSGITGYKNGFLTVGDDTPWLYYLDSVGTLHDSLRLSFVDGYVPGVRMDGSFKPDFECLTRLNENIVLIMGSGSYNAGRDTAYLVNAYEKRILAKKSMAPIFETFAEMGDIDDVHALNIEGVAVANHEVYFFNRGDLSGKNLVFKADLAQFISFFTEVDTLDVTDMYELTPYNDEYGESTFSSCVFLPDRNIFLFSSTSEEGSRLDSLGRVVDGDIKGSFLGRIRMNEFGDSLINVIPILENDEIAPIKIEGIWMHKMVSDSVVNFIGVSDPDNGTTETYIMEIRINRLK